jgi:hypothetical protein
MDSKDKNTEAKMIDNKFSIALKAIETAQHLVKAGQEVNLSSLLDEVKKSSTFNSNS